MEAVKGWLFAIAGVVVLSSIGDGVLPKGSVKKYVRLLFGVILIIVICSPLSSGFKQSIRISERYAAFSEAENMEERERETVLRLYKANLIKKMTTSLAAVNETAEFEIVLDIETLNMEEFGKIKGTTVTVKTDDEEFCANDAIEEIISTGYGVPRKNIAIKYSGK